MSESWLHELISGRASAVRVSIVSAQGSAPREAGAGMSVYSDGFTGTVGGGALENTAIEHARLMLTRPFSTWHREVLDLPLGPSLGQCCGGRVKLLFEVLHTDDLVAYPQSADAVVVRPLVPGTAIELVRHRKDDRDDWPLTVRAAVRAMLSGTRPRRAEEVDGWFLEPLGSPTAPLFLYGAGHVGRALVRALAPLNFEIYWIDTAANRYPDEIPKNVTRLMMTTPASAVAYAPDDAWHLVMTFSHALDLEICEAVLERSTFAYLGLIASKTKRVRFQRRFRERGIQESLIQRLHAPIGLPGIRGKEPAVIAASVAADLLLRRQERETAHDCTDYEQTGGGL